MLLQKTNPLIFLPDNRSELMYETFIAGLPDRILRLEIRLSFLPVILLVIILLPHLLFGFGLVQLLTLKRPYIIQQTIIIPRIIQTIVVDGLGRGLLFLEFWAIGGH